MADLARAEFLAGQPAGLDRAADGQRVGGRGAAERGFQVGRVAGECRKSTEAAGLGQAQSGG